MQYNPLRRGEKTLPESWLNARASIVRDLDLLAIFPKTGSPPGLLACLISNLRLYLGEMSKSGQKLENNWECYCTDWQQWLTMLYCVFKSC